ncbi:MAG: response regulator [Paenibacillus sp.]|jgi:two-component system response regulator YesN|nr:response regulator [Paenibacillus sp.]
MNLMIVEDEAKLRENLAYNIPWEEHGIEVVGTAASGLDALRLYEETKPDVVLLDIQLQELDGLEVAAHLHKSDKHVKIVLLSGHNKFDYARAAIEYGVVRYLLKPAGDKAILGSVLEACRRIEEERDAERVLDTLHRQWAEYAPRLREAFYQNWIAGHYVDWEIARYSKELSIGLEKDLIFAVVVIEPDPPEESGSRFGKDDGSLLQFSIQVLAKDYFHGISSQVDCSVFPDYQGTTVLLFSGKKERPETEFIADIHLLTSRLLNAVKEYLKTTASAGIGLPALMASEVRKSYQQANRALQERIVYGNDLVVPFRDMIKTKLCIPSAPSLEKQLEVALKTGNTDKAIEVVDMLIMSGIGQAGSVDEVKENVLYFSSLLIRTIQEQRWAVTEVAGEDGESFYDLRSLQTRDQIRQWLHRTIRSICGFANNQYSAKTHEIANSMLEAVEANIHRDLTLHSLARNLYLTPSYLSRLFKRHTGRSFSEYVLERKMKRAMELLGNGSKVLETSQQIGYKDISYFAKVFRKHWGMAPGDVKKNN